MASFRYKAFSAHSDVTEGTIEAASAEAAVDALYAAGLTPFETRAMRTHERADATPKGGALIGRRLWSKFGLKALASFTVELAALIQAGLPLDGALRILSGPGASPATVVLSKALLKDVLGGAQLSEAMARHPTLFPADYRAILGAGEAGGATARVLGELAEFQNRRLEVRNRIRAALVYPAILLAMSIVSVGVIVAVLVPNLTPIFTDAGLPLPGIIGQMATMEDNALGLLAWGAGTIALAVVGWRTIRSDERALLAIDRLKLRVPVIGGFIRAREAGRFARALGTLLGAGVSMMQALRIARELVSNRHLAQAYGTAVRRIPEGVALSRALGDLALIPPSALRLLAVGEETGRVVPMLARAATSLETELQRSLDHWLGLMTPLMTLLIGGGVGGLIMSVMSAVLSINELAFK